MPEQVKQVTPPRGWARLAFRLPIWFYRLGLGGVLGNRFLLLTHTGRKSGQPRQTVLEVVRYDPDSTTFIVASGFGEKSDWVRNLRQNPDVIVQCGRQQWDMVARFLTPQEAGSELSTIPGAIRWPCRNWLASWAIAWTAPGRISNPLGEYCPWLPCMDKKGRVLPGRF